MKRKKQAYKRNKITISKVNSTTTVHYLLALPGSCSSVHFKSPAHQHPFETTLTKTYTIVTDNIVFNEPIIKIVTYKVEQIHRAVSLKQGLQYQALFCIVKRAFDVERNENDEIFSV